MKGFIGPLGDDLPSIIIIIMSLTLFFSGTLFTLNVYNTKIDTVRYLTAAIDIGRVVAGYGGVKSISVSSTKALFVSKSYGLKYDVAFVDENPSNPEYWTADASGSAFAGRACDFRPFVFDYLVAGGPGTNELKILRIRVCK